MILTATLSRTLALRVSRCAGFVCTLLTVALASISGIPAKAQSQSLSQTQPRITQRLDEARRTTLQGSTPALAQLKYDQGAVPDATPANHIVLVFKRSSAQEAELTELIEQQQQTGSASYHRWLKPEEFGNRFGPADSDIEQVKAWLQAKGFAVNAVSRGKVAIDFSGTAGQVKAAFNTELHTYQKDGVVYHANNADPQIPEALAPVITGFASLNDIKPVPYSTVKGTASYNPKTHAAQPQWNDAEQCTKTVAGISTVYECTFYPPAPSDLAVQYSLNPVYSSGITGKGVTIGVVSDSNIDLTTVQNYRTLFGFANPTNLPQVIVDGVDPGQTGDSTEAYLDVEAVAAMAPDATTNLYVAGSTLTTSGLISSIVRSVDDNAADILTVSYGACEQSLGAAGNQFFYEAWQQAAAQGQSVFVATGDGGSAGCDNFNNVAQASLGLAVNGFASTPFNTAVGGTDFYYSQWAQGKTGTALLAQLATAWGGGTAVNPQQSLIAPIAEQPWNLGYGLNINNSSLGQSIGGGSGGASSCALGTGADPLSGAYLACTGGYPKPSWQVGTGVPADGVRDIPDVSLFSSSGANLSFWPICKSNTDCLAAATVPGYSVNVTAIGGTSAATPAMAGIMALVNQSQKGRQGNPNYTLYALAAQYPNSFNDVTIGSNNEPCTKGTPNCSLDTNGDGLYTLQKYSAGVGYDQASGLGTINGANLIANWSKIAYKPTTTAFSISAPSIVHGTPLKVNTAVSGTGGTPSGYVAVVANSSLPNQTGLDSIALTNGTGSDTLSYLPGGTYGLKGVYGGDGTFAASTSAYTFITVTPEASTLTLNAVDYNGLAYPATFTTLASGAKINEDDQLILDATVAGKSGQGTATGSVTFLDGTTTLGTANLNAAGVAEFTTALPVGPHNITAVYSGDASFTTSSTSGLPLTFTQGATVLVIHYTTTTVNRVTSVYAGLPFNVTVLVQGGIAAPAPTGNVTISFGSTSYTVPATPSYANLRVGSANAVFTPTTLGNNILTATYSGDSNFAPTTYATPRTIAVLAPTLAPSSTNLVLSTTTLGPDTILTFNATVTGSVAGKTPTGSVKFLFGPFGATVALSNGQASYPVPSFDIPSGTSTVDVQYLGDTVYAQSFSALIPVTSNIGDFSLTTLTPNLLINTGTTGSATLSVSQLPLSTAGLLTGAVNFTCTSSSPAIACSMTQSSVNLPADGSQAKTTVTINTRGTTASNASPTHGGAMLAGVAALSVLFFLIPGKRRKLPGLLLMAALAAVSFGAVGCGSSGAVAGPHISGAPAGAYTVNVTANAAGVQHSLQLAITVQ